MKLEQIQGAIVRLDTLDQLMSKFNDIAMSVSDGGTGVEFEMRLKKAETVAQPKHNLENLPPYLRDLIDSGDAVVVDQGQGMFGIKPFDKSSQKKPEYTHRIEIKPTDIETLMVLGVFITRMKDEKKLILQQLSELGVQITNTK